MTIKVIFASMVIVAGLLGSGTASKSMASEYRNMENSSPQEVVDGMANKAVRGLANTTTGWLEFPKQIYITSKDDGLAKGLTVGPLKGIGMTMVRTVSGVLEAVTFFVPYPDFYSPFFDPAYVWQKE